MTTMHIQARRDLGPAARFLPRLGADTWYALSGFPIAMVALSLGLTALTTGIGLAVLWVGVPLVVAALLMARAFATAERGRISAVLGVPVPEPLYRGTTIRAVVADPQSWRDLAHALLRCVPSTVSFSLVVGWWSGVFGGLTWSLWGWALPSGPGDHDLPELLGLGDGYLTATVFYLVVGVLCAVTLPAVVRGAAVLEARFARALLTRSW